MDKKLFYFLSAIFVFIIMMLIIILIKLSSQENTSPKEVIVKLEKDHREFIPKIPDTLNFCGEEVPMFDFDVHERMERELLVNVHWSSATILYLKRSARWFPIIEPILKKNNIPNDFKYLAIIESGLTNVISPAGAAGFWQLMSPVAKEYGLEVNDKVDERFNLKKSTQVACDYLKEAYSKYKSWTMAAASYNFGMNGIDKQIGRQNSKNYYNLYLVEETSRFVFRLLAIKEIFSNPQKYGFDLNDTDFYKPIKTRNVTVNHSISDLSKFAKQQGINYKVLKIFNPWLRDNTLPNKLKKQYSFEIPESGEINLIDE